MSLVLIFLGASFWLILTYQPTGPISRDLQTLLFWVSVLLVGTGAFILFFGSPFG